MSLLLPSAKAVHKFTSMTSMLQFFFITALPYDNLLAAFLNKKLVCD